MVVNKLFFENFRNFGSLDLPVSQGFTVLVGPNGAGKTNFLEGISVGMVLRRFPQTKVPQLLKIGEGMARVRIWANAGIEKTQEVYLEKRGEGERLMGIYKVNNQRQTRERYTDGFSVISFLPQDLDLFTRSPASRRRFLNDVLSNTSAGYRAALRSYVAALKQRNNLWEKVKAGKDVVGNIAIWDEALAEFGSILTQGRQDFLDYLNKKVGVILDKLSPELVETRFLYHKSGADTKAEFLERLQLVKKQEEAAGRSLLGPHRDDFLASHRGLEVAGYFSRGQMRSLVQSLKMIEREYLEEKRGRSPILLLDDVFSEFDEGHQQRLAEFLKSFRQVFITSTHLRELEFFLPHSAQIFRIVSGQIIS